MKYPLLGRDGGKIPPPGRDRDSTLPKGVFQDPCLSCGGDRVGWFGDRGMRGCSVCESGDFVGTCDGEFLAEVAAGVCPFDACGRPLSRGEDDWFSFVGESPGRPRPWRATLANMSKVDAS